MTDAPIDPFVAALERELEAHRIAMPQDMDPDVVLLSGIARSLLNREREIEDIQAWTAARVQTLHNQIEGIKRYRMPDAMRAVERLTRGTKSKSVKVPGYQFGFRATPTRISWEPEDKDALLEWAQDNCPDAVTVTTPEPRAGVQKTALVEFYERTGRVPRCCSIQQAGDTPYARPWQPKKKKGQDDEQRQHDTME